MNDRFTTWLPLVLLVVLAGLTVWLNHSVQLPEPGIAPNQRHDPDYFVEDFNAVRIGDTGKPSYTLHSKRMVHYPDDDSTDLEAPEFVDFSKVIPAPVTITARRGSVSSKGNNVYFRDNVVVTRAPYDDRSALVMKTEFLHIIPDDQYAETKLPVTIYDADTIVHAIGLKFSNKTHILHLLSQVHGTYEQPQTSATAKRP